MYDNYIKYWKQLSKSQTRSFVVLGYFDTTAKAENARLVLEEIIQTIRDSYRATYPDEDSLGKILSDTSKLPKLIAQEEAIKQQYNITDWELGHVWTYFAENHEAVRQYDKLLLVGNFDETWSGYKPFDSIVRQLGGQVDIQIQDKWRYLTIKCDAPDEAKARKIVEGSDRVRVGGLTYDFHIQRKETTIIISGIDVQLSPDYLEWDTIATVKYICEFLLYDCSDLSFSTTS